MNIETFLGKNFKAMLKPAFLWALPILIISLLLTFAGVFIGLLFTAKESAEGTTNLLPFISGILISLILVNFVYALFLYLGLRSMFRKLPMEKYESRLNFCVYVSIFIILLDTILASLINLKFTLGRFGIIPLAIMFILPALYKPKPVISQ